MERVICDTRWIMVVIIAHQPIFKVIEMEEDLIYRLRERARIRRQIPGRKSVQENKPDRIADLLEEAANEIERLKNIS